jgi:hypothetical protein
MNEQYLNNLVRVARFVNDECVRDHTGFIESTYIQVDGLDGMYDIDVDETTRIGRLHAKIFSKIYARKIEQHAHFIEDIDALEKLIIAGYFSTLIQEKKVDAVGIVINLGAGSIRISLGKERNKLVTRLIGKFSRLFTVDIKNDEKRYHWNEWYGDFTAKDGITLAQDWRNKMDESFSEAVDEKKQLTAEEILENTLSIRSNTQT